MTNSQYDIQVHGDILERQASGFIRTHIPAYEKIWKRYIGHDGQGQMAKITNATQEQLKKRILFAQHHYTILESIYFMYLLANDYQPLRQVESFDEYRKVINDIMAFQAYSGRIRDNVGKCGSIISGKYFAKELKLSLSEFYSQRHIFIHGCKVPFCLEEGLFKMPETKKNTDAVSGYGKNAPWDSIKHSEMEHLTDLLSNSMTDLLPKVNSILSKILEKVLELVDQYEMQLVPPSDESVYRFDFSTSMGPQGEQGFISASGIPPKDFH